MAFDHIKLSALSVSTIFLLSACASQDSNPAFSSEPMFVMQPSLVKVEVKPDGVKVDLDLSSGRTLSCISPCELDTSGQRIRAITLSGEGLETLKTNKPFVANSYNRDVIGFRLQPDFEAIIAAQLLPPGQREILNRDIAGRKTVPANCLADTPRSPDAVPIVRTPPRMPVELGKSGTCNMTFNVNSYGYVVDPVVDCTDEGFAPAATESVSEWSYSPPVKDGQAISICGVTTKLTFRMMNGRGEVLPE